MTVQDVPVPETWIRFSFEIENRCGTVRVTSPTISGEVVVGAEAITDLTDDEASSEVFFAMLLASAIAALKEGHEEQFDRMVAELKVSMAAMKRASEDAVSILNGAIADEAASFLAKQEETDENP